RSAGGCGFGRGDDAGGRSGDDQGEEGRGSRGRSGGGQGGGKGAGEGRREGAGGESGRESSGGSGGRQRGGKESREEEIVGEAVSHCRFGQSRRRVFRDAAQHRFYAGGVAGEGMGVRVEDGKEVSRAGGAGGTGGAEDYFVPAADVYERQRRGDWGVAAVLPGGAGAVAGGGGRRGFGVGDDPVAGRREQRGASWIGIHRAAVGGPGLC